MRRRHALARHYIENLVAWDKGVVRTCTGTTSTPPLARSAKWHMNTNRRAQERQDAAYILQERNSHRQKIRKRAIHTLPLIVTVALCMLYLSVPRISKARGHTQSSFLQRHIDHQQHKAPTWPACASFAATRRTCAEPA